MTALLALMTAALLASPSIEGAQRAVRAPVRTALPAVSDTLPALWHFLEALNAEIGTGTISSTEQLIERCRQFYTADRMAQIEAIIPGWKHMASFEEGKTLWHVTVAMVALLRLPEYQSLSPGQQAVQQWIVLLHDLAKEPAGGRDHRHTFRSAAQAGRVLPAIGYPVTAAYSTEFPVWFKLTDAATRFDPIRGFEIQDNRKLREILEGARRIFGEPTRTAVVAIALHQSITSLAAWPVQAPLTDDQVKAYVDVTLLRPLLTLTLADTGGWSLFDPPALAAMYKETRDVFGAVSRSLPR